MGAGAGLPLWGKGRLWKTKTSRTYSASNSSVMGIRSTPPHFCFYCRRRPGKPVAALLPLTSRGAVGEGKQRTPQWAAGGCRGAFFQKEGIWPFRKTAVPSMGRSLHSCTGSWKRDPGKLLQKKDVKTVFVCLPLVARPKVSLAVSLINRKYK